MIPWAARTALAAALCSALAATAQQLPPDAGGQLRDQEKRPPELPKKPPPRLEVEQPARPPLKAAPAVRFELKDLRITGNSVLTNADLRPLVADLIGREVGFDELEAAAARITRLYRERGYLLARAYLPAQEIRDGAVEIAVLEGRLGAVELQNRSRVSDAAMRGYLDGLTGQVVDDANLERKLLLLSDLPGMGPSAAALRPGERVGESALALDVREGPGLEGTPFTGAGLEADNYGSYYSGEYRLTARLEMASPSGYGDLVTAELTKGFPGLDLVRLAYQLPLGSDGLRAGVAYSGLRYVLGEEFTALGANGRADSFGANLSYPMVRTRAYSITGQIGAVHRSFEDRFDALGTATEKSTDAGLFSLTGDWFDGFAGGAANVWSLGYTYGLLDIETPAARAIDDATLGTRGTYGKLAWSWLRAQRLGGAWSAQLSFSGQSASTNLDSSEKFSLGGPYGVRAFPLGEASGDDGALASAELRVDLFSRSLQLLAFLDGGTIRINHEPLAGVRNERNLQAAGVGMVLSYERSLSLRAIAAWGNEQATAAPERRPRGWVQIAYRL